MHLFVIAFLSVFSLSNIYLGYRFLSVFKNQLPVPSWFIVIAWIFLALCSILFRNDSSLIAASITDFFYMIGAYWIVVVFYGFMITVLCDLISMLQKFTGIYIFRQSAQLTGYCIIAIITLCIIYGTYNASNPVVKNYHLTIDKKAATKKMRVFLVSDIHLGKIHDGKIINKIVDKVNELQPDVLLLAGDTIDSDLKSVYRKQPLYNLKNAKTKYGVYAIMGNHEYIGKEGKETVDFFEQNGIKMLINEDVHLPNEVHLYGRNDFSNDKKALSLAVEQSKPIIVMDHQPVRIEETVKNGVDLLLCGHTHKGQIFPNNLITKRLYKIDYGYKKFDNLNVIVTCGIGTWGPPMRIGNTPEFVCIDINFKE